MSTLLDVAKRAGVAPITVSRVINNSGYFSAETRTRVEEAIKELGYVPNVLARGLRSKRTNTLALMVTDITNPYFTLMARGVEDAAGAANYTVIYCNTDESELKEVKYANIMAQRQVDGVLLVPACGNSQTTQYLKSKDIKVVIVDRQVSGIDADFVRADSIDGARQITNLLINKGHERIVAITGPSTVSTSLDRVVGYQLALKEAGLQNYETVHYGSFTQQNGYESTLEAMQANPKPTAIFAANNFILLGVIKALRELNLVVPDDISVVGFDDFPESMLIKPFFTVVIQPAYEMGRLAAELIIDRIANTLPEDYQELVLPTDIIERESCGPVRKQT
jgi:LacI family transcriptional regulator